MVPDGPANVGKTTMLLRPAREIEIAQAPVNPEYRRHGITPVVHIEVTPRPTPKTIAAAILDFFGTPAEKRRTQRELVRNATELMLQRWVELLEVDQLQTLRLQGAHGDDAIDTPNSITRAPAAKCKPRST